MDLGGCIFSAIDFGYFISISKGYCVMYGLTDRRGGFDSTNSHDVGAWYAAPRRDADSPRSRSSSTDSRTLLADGHDGDRRVTRSPSPDPSAFDGLRRRACSDSDGNTGVPTRSLLDGDEDSDDDVAGTGRDRSSSVSDGDSSVQGGADGKRSAAWDKLAAVGGRFRDWIAGVAKKFAAVGEFVGVIAGGLSAAVISAFTLGIAPIIWNSVAGPGDDMFTSFMLAGGTTGKFIGGAVGVVVGTVTSPIGVPVKAAFEKRTSPEQAGYERVDAIELDDLGDPDDF